MDAADFYTGIVVKAYALLRSTHFSADRYAGFIAATGEPALELGCGDGDPLLELRRRGLEDEGVDSSADMLARCGQRASEAGLEVVTHHQRMEYLSLDRRFRTVFLGRPTFNLLPDDALAHRALTQMGKHLQDGGAAYVPLWIPPPTPKDALGLTRESHGADGALVRFTALSEDYDAAARTRTTHTRYERHTPDGPQIADRDWVIHWHTQESMRALARTRGCGLPP